MGSLNIPMSHLDRLPWSKHPACRVDGDIEGYRDFTFGGRAGPEKDNGWNALHEMAHAVQFGVRRFRTRVTEAGEFVFRSPGWIYIAGQMIGKEYAGTRASMRELETFAIQKRMIEMLFGIQDEGKYAAYVTKLASWLPDSYNLYGELLSTTDNNSGTSIELTRRHIARFYDGWEPERIEQEMAKWLNKTQKTLSMVEIQRRRPNGSNS